MQRDADEERRHLVFGKFRRAEIMETTVDDTKRSNTAEDDRKPKIVKGVKLMRRIAFDYLILKSCVEEAPTRDVHHT